MLGVLLAVMASAMNAAASVLQRKADRDESSFGWRMLLDVARRPAWWAGIGSVLLGFGLQAVALAVSPVSVVQPLLISELPLTLLLASLVFRRAVAGRDWWAVLAMAVGLAVFSYCLQPSGGKPLRAPLWTWIVGLAASFVVMAALTVAGRRTKGGRRAALLGLATGVGFGTTAVLVAAVGAAGVGAMFVTWQTYAVVVIGPTSFFLLQHTLQAGELVASQPGMTLSNPLVAMAWGFTVFGEHARGGGWMAGEIVGAALIALGTLTLVRSPVLKP
ncbi:DMT family transporter [Kutzneria chonburiensis]|uniref:DMT family transporter n=1 Tax=Kutzneria chonburiensis TaxID=1483604 RepID=A0ABV6MPV8_9PSEU|nr:DMT family transporter [Kutzneria chonburiensis]